jgi:hypothetical protein
VRRFGSDAIKTAVTNPLVIGGSIALAGLILYSLLPRNCRATVHSLRELPRPLRHLPETVAETTRRFADAAKSLSDAVSIAIGDRVPDADANNGR